MVYFADLAAFRAYFAGRVISADHHVTVEVERQAESIEREAKARIGHYQNAVGPFAAWAPLANTTLNGFGQFPGKVELGYAPPDNPLLREGDLRDSIHHSATGHQASVGSNEQNMVWQELGTRNMPPRSVLGGAAASLSDHVAHRIGELVYEVLAGLRP